MSLRGSIRQVFRYGASVFIVIYLGIFHLVSFHGVYISAEIDALVTEVISLSGYVKVTLVILSILLVSEFLKIFLYGCF